MRRFSVRLLILSAVYCLGLDRAAATPFTFGGTGNLNTARFNHTATLLPNGKVLVAGGVDSNGDPSASAELYDPASGTWSVTGSLKTGRQLHTATLLPNGKVLVAGGLDSNGNPSTSAELYDPASGTWSATGSLNTARHTHTATLLPNGKVLVAGGTDNLNSLASAELYDPASGTWTATGSLNTSRLQHTATFLPNGKVLVAGGFASSFNNGSQNPVASAELYDPASGTWSATGSLNTARFNHTATLLPNGKVLVAGGVDSSGNPVASAELYNPASGTWSATGNLNAARDLHTATSLPNDKVLVAGGEGSTFPFPPSASAELYDPASGSWAATGSLNTARDLHTATSLPNGKVLVAGGVDDSSFDPSASAELYDSSPTTLANISSRLPVQTGDNVLIGGFIVTGTQQKKVIIRALGPSVPVPGALADPTLELYSGSTLLEANDNWVDSPNKQAIIDSGIAPSNNRESAIVRALPANNSAYTAIVRGVNNTTGIGVVEVYDLDRSVDSKLANISTRGLVQTGDNVLIAGTIILGETPQKVIVRALGPSTGVPGAMADPTLELRDSNGALLEANDNWVDSPNKQAIIDSTIPPKNNLESAIVRTLPANGAQYTAIVRGVNNTTGIAVVEIYALQ